MDIQEIIGYLKCLNNQVEAQNHQAKKVHGFLNGFSQNIPPDQLKALGVEIRRHSKLTQEAKRLASCIALNNATINIYHKI